ncbi:hypothetical protein R1flu_016806 [Riccia fluitans]|uniref:ARM repeat superfamily protein n=1 Tax=Riccia fluitans TaxID=41844 RepID=A0ABD1YN19_9MARC
MKRVREIDLEAPVVEDEDVEEEGDSFTSGWNRRSPTKKSRWMEAHDSDTARQISFSGVWPRDLGMGFDTNGEAQDIPDKQQSSLGMGDTLFLKSRPFAGIDLQLAIPSGDSPEIKHHEDVDTEIHENHYTKTPEPPFPVNRLEEAVDSAGSTERRSVEIQVPDVKTKLLNNSSSAAGMLYPEINQQDKKLHSFLEKQSTRLHDEEAGVRLEAARKISGRLAEVREITTRNLVIDSIQQQLWKEVDLSVSVALVKLLSDTAVVCCADDSQQENKGSIRMSPSQSVALVLSEYIKTKDVPNSPMKSVLKLQILRAFYAMVEKSKEIMEVDSLQDFAAVQLASSNPRLRLWGVRLIVASIRDRKTGDSEKHRRVLPGHMLKAWNKGQSLMGSLLGYTRDPHPSVREGVIVGLMNLLNKGYSLHSDTYKHAVALLKDSFEEVRIHAVKMVGLCAREMLDGAQRNVMDNAFLRLCNMMTDMSMPVREEVCHTLGEMTGVSDSLLLQSLSKKVLSTSAADQDKPASVSKEVVVALEEKNLLSWGAGAFAVALEDEFWEVRLAAVKALAKLGIASEKMGSGALVLVVDMINDDSSSVRHRTIQALASLARAGRLVVNQPHLHMFQGVLEDSSVDIRKAGLDLLSSITLPSISSLKETVRAVLTSFEKHPEDEESSFTALEKLGFSHGNYTECIISELLQELRGLLNKESGLDDPQCVGILVLILAAATSNAKIISAVPPHILGLERFVKDRFRSSLPSVVFQPIGFQSVRYTWFSKKSSSDGSDQGGRALGHESRSSSSYQEFLHKQKAIGGGQRIVADQNDLMRESSGDEQKSLLLPELQYSSCLSKAEEEAVFNCIQNILSIALNSSSSLELRNFRGVLQRLRGCRKELKVLKEKCVAPRGAVTFCSVYLNCLQVLVQIQASFTNQVISHIASKRSDLPHDLLQKLELGVKHLLYRFMGLSYAQLVQVYELYAIALLWKLVLHPREALSSDRASSLPFQELGSITAASKRLSEDENTSPSSLLRTIQEQILSEEGSAKATIKWKCAREVALSYWPCEMSVVAPISEMWADMNVPGPDFDHRIEFVPGLPLGISVDITLHNVPEKSSLWIQFAVDSSAVEYRYLDIGDSQIDPACNVRQFSTTLRIENMQAGASCVSRICIVLAGMEQQGHKADQSMGRGPKGPVVPLCNEKEANLINLLIKERTSKLAPPISR